MVLLRLLTDFSGCAEGRLLVIATAMQLPAAGDLFCLGTWFDCCRGTKEK